jgi:choline dehydrogenase-like flavoprotein
MDDVIVVGGGPTGFISALGLAQAGVRLTLIESEAKIIDSPRAAVCHWAVIDGLERLGIREEVAVISESADPSVLDRYSEVRRGIFLNHISPQAVANKRLIYHANGGEQQLEEALMTLRRLPTDRDFLLQHLMFLKSLETPALLGMEQRPRT